MKLIFTLTLLASFSTSFSQWIRVDQLPASDIFTIYHKDNILYAGGKKIIYISRDRGQTWDSTTAIPQLSILNTIIVHKNELYAAGPRAGVFKSADGGATWQDLSAGIFPDIADFCEFRGNLYAATFGNSVYKLNPVNGNSWIFFSNGLSDLSANLPSIAGNSNALVAGTLANGIYAHLPANSITWEERLLAGQLDPNEGAYDIVTAHDTLFYSGRTGKFYMSTDNGLNWNFIGNRLVSAATTLVNAKQAVLVSRHIFENGSFNTLFYYIKKNALQNPFINFSVAPDHFTYKTDILGDKLWDASNKGLFFMSLSDLPEISADDAEITPLPVQFTSFRTNCEGGKVLIAWQTAQEQNGSHFNIERSIDGANWTMIGKLPASGSSIHENSYSFTDNSPLQNGYYRIAQYDLDGKVQYTGMLRAACNTMDVFRLWPNPAHDIVFINIASSNKSQAVIKIFDSKGALVKIQGATVWPGSNQLGVDMKSLVIGMYSLTVDWNNGQMKKSAQVLKQ